MLEYRLFREVPELDRPFLLADYEQEARALGVTGSLWVEAASAGADPARGARLGAGAGRREQARRRPRRVRRARATRRTSSTGCPGGPGRPWSACGGRSSSRSPASRAGPRSSRRAARGRARASSSTSCCSRRRSRPCSTWSRAAPARSSCSTTSASRRSRARALGAVGDAAARARRRGRTWWRSCPGSRPKPTAPAGRRRDLRPYVEHALETFGPARLLYGSDWPVVELAGGHARWLEAVTELLDGAGGRGAAGDLLGERAAGLPSTVGETVSCGSVTRTTRIKGPVDAPPGSGGSRIGTPPCLHELETAFRHLETHSDRSRQAPSGTQGTRSRVLLRHQVRAAAQHRPQPGRLRVT